MSKQSLEKRVGQLVIADTLSRLRIEVETYAHRFNSREKPYVKRTLRSIQELNNIWRH